ARPRAPGLARTNGEERQEQARGEERRSLHAANVTQARSSSREPRAPPEIGFGSAAEHRRARNSSRRNETLRRMTNTFRAWLQHTCGSPARRSAGHSGPVTSPLDAFRLDIRYFAAPSLAVCVTAAAIEHARKQTILAWQRCVRPPSPMDFHCSSFSRTV